MDDLTDMIADAITTAGDWRCDPDCLDVDVAAVAVVDTIREWITAGTLDPAAKTSVLNALPKPTEEPTHA